MGFTTYPLRMESTLSLTIRLNKDLYRVSPSFSSTPEASSNNCLHFSLSSYIFNFIAVTRTLNSSSPDIRSPVVFFQSANSFLKLCLQLEIIDFRQFFSHLFFASPSHPADHPQLTRLCPSVRSFYFFPRKIPSGNLSFAESSNFRLFLPYLGCC